MLTNTYFYRQTTAKRLNVDPPKGRLIVDSSVPLPSVGSPWRRLWARRSGSAESPWSAVVTGAVTPAAAVTVVVEVVVVVVVVVGCEAGKTKIMWWTWTGSYRSCGQNCWSTNDLRSCTAPFLFCIWVAVHCSNTQQ